MQPVLGPSDRLTQPVVLTRPERFDSGLMPRDRGRVHKHATKYIVHLADETHRDDVEKNLNGAERVAPVLGHEDDHRRRRHERRQHLLSQRDGYVEEHIKAALDAAAGWPLRQDAIRREHLGAAANVHPGTRRRFAPRVEKARAVRVTFVHVRHDGHCGKQGPDDHDDEVMHLDIRARYDQVVASIDVGIARVADGTAAVHGARPHVGFIRGWVRKGCVVIVASSRAEARQGVAKMVIKQQAAVIALAIGKGQRAILAQPAAALLFCVARLRGAGLAEEHD